MNGQHFTSSGSANGTPTPPSNSSYPASLSSQSSRDPSPASRLGLNSSLPPQFGNSSYGQQILTNSITHTTATADLKYQSNMYSQNPQIWNNSSKGPMSFPNHFSSPNAIINQNSVVSPPHISAATTNVKSNLITQNSGFSSTEFLANDVSNRLDNKDLSSPPVSQFNSILKISDMNHPIPNSNMDRVVRPPSNPLIDGSFAQHGIPAARTNSNSIQAEQLLNEENKNLLSRFQAGPVQNASAPEPPLPAPQTQQAPLSPPPPPPSHTHTPPQSEMSRISPQTPASSHSQDSSPKPNPSSTLHSYASNTLTTTKFLPPATSQYQAGLPLDASAQPAAANILDSLQTHQVQTQASSTPFANQLTHPKAHGSGDNEIKPIVNSMEKSHSQEPRLQGQHSPPLPPQQIKQLNSQPMQQPPDASQPIPKFPNTQANQFPPTSFGQFHPNPNEQLAPGVPPQHPLKSNVNSQINTIQLGSNFGQYQKSQMPVGQPSQHLPATLTTSQIQPSRVGHFPPQIPPTSVGQQNPLQAQQNRVGQFAPQIPPSSTVGQQDLLQAQQNRVGQFAPQIPPSSTVGQQEPLQAQPNRVGQFAPQIPPSSTVGQQDPLLAQQNRIGQFAPQIPPSSTVGQQDPLQAQQNRIGQFAPQIPPSSTVGQQEPLQAQPNRIGQFAPQIPPSSTVGQQAPSQSQQNRVSQFSSQIPSTGSVGQQDIPPVVTPSQFQPKPPIMSVGQQFQTRNVGYNPQTSISPNVRPTSHIPPASFGQSQSSLAFPISATQQQKVVQPATSAAPHSTVGNLVTSQPRLSNSTPLGQYQPINQMTQPNQMPRMPHPHMPPMMTPQQILRPNTMTSQYSSTLPPTGQHPPATSSTSQLPPYTGNRFQPPTNISGGTPPIAPEHIQFQNRLPNQSSHQNQYPRPHAPLSSMPYQQPATTGPPGSMPYQQTAPTGPPGSMPYQQTASTGPYMQNRYPAMPPQGQRTVDGLANQLRSPPNIAHDGYNKLWGMDTFDLLKTRDLLPRDRIDAPPIKLNPELYDATNCSPELFRCTLSKIPESKSLLEKSRLPLGVLIHPFKDLNQLSVIQCSTIVRCRVCRTYINPFVYFVDNKRWKCNLCFRVNELPDEFQFDPISKTYGDPSRRPEIKSATIEFIAPSEYMVRPPQPAIYLFLLDVSRLGAECGYLNVVCETLLEELENLPGDARTSVGFITYDSNVHFYSLAEGLSQPHQMVVVDIDEMFLPCPDNLLVNLNESMDLIRDLLTQLPSLYSESFDTESALGAALQAAYKLLAPTGGRVTVFQARLPSKGPGALISREDPSQRAGDSVPHLNPSTDFYKKLALDCSSQQIAVDLFLVNSQYIDVATLSGISRFSGGCMHHVPLFRSVNPLQVKMLKKSFQRYLTRKIGFESVMRLRCTRGLSIHTFHGNFFVRSTDLLSLPNVNPDAGFGMQVSIDESLSELQNVCFQAALLYTSSKGERRIRVHTLCLPISSSLSDILNGADQHCIIGLLSKMAVDRSMESSIADAREAFVNVAADILSAYKLTQSSSTIGSVLAPTTLRLIPLYVLALLKFVAFRIGQSTRLDDRVFGMCQMKSLPLATLLQSIYPDLYPIHDLESQPVVEQGAESESVPNPPKLHLSAERVDSHGIYLLDNGSMLLIYVGHNIHPNLCQALFGVPHFTALPQDMYDLPELDTTESDRLCTFIHHLTSEKSYVPCVQIIRDDSHHRMRFLEQLIEDKNEAGTSYYEFLQRIKVLMK